MSHAEEIDAAIVAFMEGNDGLVSERDFTTFVRWVEDAMVGRSLLKMLLDRKVKATVRDGEVVWRKP